MKIDYAARIHTVKKVSGMVTDKIASTQCGTVFCADMKYIQVIPDPSRGNNG